MEAERNFIETDRFIVLLGGRCARPRNAANERAAHRCRSLLDKALRVKQRGVKLSLEQ
jgi:hypothetical protein